MVFGVLSNINLLCYCVGNKIFIWIILFFLWKILYIENYYKWLPLAFHLVQRAFMIYIAYYYYNIQPKELFFKSEKRTKNVYITHFKRLVLNVILNRLGMYGGIIICIINVFVTKETIKKITKLIFSTIFHNSVPNLRNPLINWNKMFIIYVKKA